MTRVEIADLEHIVATVRRAHERLTERRGGPMIGPFKRAAFLALRAVAYSIPIALGLLLLGIFLLDWGGSLQALLVLAWLVIAIFLLLPLTLLNLPLMVTAWKQRRLIVSRDLLVPAFPAWLLKARWVVTAVGVAAAVLALTVDSFGWDGFILVLLVVVFPFLLVMMQSFLGLARRNLDLMRSVQELHTILEDKLDEAHRESRTHIELSHELRVKLSETAEGILSGERLGAIGDSMRAPTNQYSVSQSSAFRDGLQAYTPEVQLQLLDRLQELAQNRQPEGAVPAAAGGRWIWTLSDLGIDLEYEIAEDNQQLLVREARPSTVAGEPPDGAG